MPDIKLDADQLGHVAEAQFVALCAQAGWVANKSDRDRTGWDFIVEAPMSLADSRIPLDQRQPTSCHVQLKSVAGAGGRVKLRLSSADRLAKDPRPAILIVLRLDARGELQAGFLIHLIGAPLAKVLRRLREAEAAGRRDTNRMTISFDVEKTGRRFAPTPEGLRAALLAACGDAPAAYVAEKQRQLAELGYEGGRFEIDAIFAETQPGELVDILLGLRPGKPLQLRAYDARFGIRLPVESLGPADCVEINFEPQVVASCAIQIRGPGLGPPAVFPADLAVPPPELLGSEHTKIVARHKEIVVALGPGMLSMSTTRPFLGVGRPLAAWRTLLRGLAYLATGQGRLALTQWDRLEGPIEFEMTTPLDGPYLEDLPYYVKLVEAARRLLNAAGVEVDPILKFEDIYDLAMPVFLAADLLFAETRVATFTVDSDNEGDSFDVLYVNRLDVGDAGIGYSVRLGFRRAISGETTFRAESFAPLDVRPLATHEFDEYVTSQSETHALPAVLRQDHVAMENLPSS